MFGNYNFRMLECITNLLYICIMVSSKEQHTNSKRFYRNWLNTYTVLGMLFLIWMCFISDNSRWEIYKLNKKIANLKEEREYYKEKIERDKKSQRELYSSKENLEKFAREHYYMKESDEDVYIIIRD